MEDVKTSIINLDAQTEAALELCDSLEEKQVRIHVQRQICFGVEEITPRSVGRSKLYLWLKNFEQRMLREYI